MVAMTVTTPAVTGNGRALGDCSALGGRGFAAVLFDLDGTLVDSTPAVERSWLVWAGEFGVDPQVLADTHGKPTARMVGELIAPEQQDQALARIDQLELDDLEGIEVLPGAAEALAALDDQHRAIATSCSTALMQARITASGLERPAVVVTSTVVRHGKPDPEPYLLAAELLGVRIEDCLVVEDAPAGLRSGRAAGATTLAVVTTTPAEALDADAVVADLSQVRFCQDQGEITVVPADQA